jgi:hypothetical protein
MKDTNLLFKKVGCNLGSLLDCLAIGLTNSNENNKNSCGFHLETCKLSKKKYIWQ